MKGIHPDEDEAQLLAKQLLNRFPSYSRLSFLPSIKLNILKWNILELYFQIIFYYLSLMHFCKKSFLKILIPSATDHSKQTIKNKQLKFEGSGSTDRNLINRKAVDQNWFGG